MASVYYNLSLSLKEKGLLAMLSVAEEYGDHDLTAEDFVHWSSDGRASVLKAMNGLIEKGFVERETLRSNGRIIGVRYKLKEELDE